MTARPEIEIRWNIPQSLAIQSRTRYVDLEGAIRSGKSTPAVVKVQYRCIEEPGVHTMISRWTDDGVSMQLKPLFMEWAERIGVARLLHWNGGESCFEWPNGSKTWARGLKASELASRYAKFSGLTLSHIFVDQAEEIPNSHADVFAALKGRLSQQGYYHQLMVAPNPPAYGHWLCTEFPEDNSKSDHLYLHTSIYDNADNLPAHSIRALEENYPEGHPLRRRFLEGHRGLNVEGDPVYGPSVFSRATHVREVEYDPTAPLLEAWDFGHRRPAVLWSQFIPRTGQWRVLGECMGDNQFLEDFAPLALMVLGEFCEQPMALSVCCDPAGSSRSNQGLKGSATDILSAHGRHPTYQDNSNDLKVRYGIIQHVASACLRQVEPGIPAVVVHPRCKTVVEALEGGYVWDDRVLRMAGNLRVPRKDGYYDHLMNCAEYTWHNYGPSRQSKLHDLRAVSALQRQILRQAQMDHDEFDVGRRRTGRARGRQAVWR